MDKKPKITTRRWLTLGIVLSLYLLFLYWVESWWGLLLVPFIIAVPMLAKYQSIRQATEASARTAAFECTVRIEDCHQDAATGEVADQIRRRHFSQAHISIRSDEAPEDGQLATESNRFWVDRKGKSLLDSYGDVALNITQERFNAIANPGNRLVNNLVTAAGTLAGPSRFGLELKRGLFTAQVQSRVPLDSWWADAVPGRADEPLVFSSSLAVVADSWNASSSKGDEVRSVASRVAKGRRLMPWDAMVRLARLGKTDGVGDAVRNASAEQMGRLNRLDLDTGFELIHAPITASIHTLGRGDAHANPGRRFDYHQIDVDVVPRDRLEGQQRPASRPATRDGRTANP